MKVTKGAVNLGKEPIGTLLAKMAIPATIAMIVNGLFYVVDAAFVGIGVGTHALGGLAIVFPFQMFSIAIGSMFGLGAASIVARELGAKNIKRAEDTTGNAFMLSIIAGLLFFLLIMYYRHPLLMFFGATEGNLTYAEDYLIYIVSGFVFVFLSMVGVSVIRSEGNSSFAGWCMILGAAINVILDPILIMGCHLGIKGAAIATLIARAIQTLVSILYYMKGKSQLSLNLSNLRLQFSIVKEIIAVGAGTCFAQMSFSILALVMNLSLAHYGNDLYIAVYGVMSRILVFITMPLTGISHGFQPIAGFNYGAGKYVRVKQSVRLSLIVSTGICILLFLILFGFTKPVLSLFSNDTSLVAIGARPLKITVIFLPIIGIQIITFSYFQALGKVIPTLIVSLSRQFLFLVPLLIILPWFFGLNGIWYAYPTADLASVILSLLWIRTLSDITTPKTIEKKNVYA